MFRQARPSALLLILKIWYGVHYRVTNVYCKNIVKMIVTYSFKLEYGLPFYGRRDKVPSDLVFVCYTIK